MEKFLKIKSKIPIKLLYVEDESIIREQLGQLLGRIVKEVISASDGEEGLKAFLEYAPEMIVTDINMPRLNGLDMAKEIRKYDKNVPIIITTAHSESEFLLEAIEVGVSDFLLKPVDIDNLVKVIERKSHDIILEKEVQKQQRRFEAILNLQEDLIILTSGMDIIEVNKSFLEFFDVKNIEEFKSVYGSIESQMVCCGGGSIRKIDGEEWIKNLLSSRFDRNIAKITNKKTGELQTFMVKAAKFLDEEEELYIVTMSDITELESRAKILETLATTDALTKIFNRLKLNELLSFEVKKSDRYRLPLTLIMLDIDHFKDINDTYGHDIGDEVLVKLCETISCNIRETDVFARWGGEEFMIMLPNTSLDGAKVMAENLRMEIESACFEKAQRVTASFGVAEYSPDSSIREFLKQVDDSLYAAKRGGRNMVVAL